MSSIVIGRAGSRAPQRVALSIAAAGAGLMAWLGLASFGALQVAAASLMGLGAGLWGLARARSPQTTLDATGLRDRLGHIPWRDVRRAVVQTTTAGPCLTLTVPRARYRHRAHPHDDGADGRDTVVWPVDLSVMSVSLDDLDAAVRRWAPAATRDAVEPGEQARAPDGRDRPIRS